MTSSWHASGHANGHVVQLVDDVYEETWTVSRRFMSGGKGKLRRFAVLRTPRKAAEKEKKRVPKGAWLYYAVSRDPNFTIPFTKSVGGENTHTI